MPPRNKPAGFDQDNAKPAQRRLRFGPDRRLRRKQDVDRVFQAKCSASCGLCIVYVAPNGLDRSRLAVSAPKRLGNAVRRNRLKRLVREAFRTSESAWNGWDLLAIIKPKPSPRDNEPSLDKVKQDLQTAADRAIERFTKRRHQPTGPGE